MRIVWDYVDAAIKKKLDAALADCPDAEKDRQHLYGQLLDYFDKHGELPEFTIEKKGEESRS